MKNTTLIHIEKDGKYLMMHRIKKENDINKDKWIGIGGKFVENEDPYQCAIREAKEETGLDIVPCYRGIVTFVNDVCEGEYMHIFTSSEFSGSITECDEGVLEWIDKKALYNMNDIWEGDKIFLKLLEENAPFFHLRLEYSGDKLVSAVLNNKKIQIC